MTNSRFAVVDRYLLRPVICRYNAEHEFTQSKRQRKIDAGAVHQYESRHQRRQGPAP